MPQQDSLQIYRNRLPHWRMLGSTYYITWGLHKNRSQLIPSERTVVANCLEHFHGIRYQLYGYVVMDDHVHVVVYPIDRFPINKTVHTWKSFTAHEINRLRAEKGHFWLKDSYDRIVRDEAELIEKLQYMLDNPLKRWPDTQSYEWAKWFPWAD